MMLQRRLGRTNHMSSVVIMGTAAFWQIDQEGANATLDLALEHGINHIDVAPQYGDAQVVTGPWLESRRDKFFVGCKTQERERDAARADLENSLRLLRTDWFDLYQFHAVTTMDELKAITKPGGAAETFFKARDEGLARFLGITTHGMYAPSIAVEAIERMDLDTVMFPLNPRLYADAQYRADSERLLALCQERDVGVQIIKSVAKGPWAGREKTYGPWYEPYADAQGIAASVRFVLSQPGVTAIVSAADVGLLPLIIEAAQGFEPMDAAEQEALIQQRAADALIFDGPDGVN